MGGKLWTKDEDQFVKDNYLTMEASDMAKKLGRSSGSVYTRCCNNKLHKGNRLYTYNENFFNEPNIISAYWAGLIAADGYIEINRERRRLSLTLKLEDGYQIERFKGAINYTGPVYYRRYIKNSFARLDLNCAESLFIQLDRHYNIGPKKSLTLQPPNLTDELLIKSYIIGYLDGDGSIQTRKKARYPLLMAFTGTYSLLNWIKYYLEAWYPIENKRRRSQVNADHSIYQYVVAGERAHIILKDLSSLNVPFLKRKWDKVTGG